MSDSVTDDKTIALVVKAGRENQGLEKTVAINSSKGDVRDGPVAVGVGCTLKERFYLESVLGIGGMGTVYKAKDLRQAEVGEKNPWLAIKILNKHISQHAFSWGALQRECKKTQQLSHPHIVSVFDFDRDGDTLFMSMELLEGVSLDEIINKPSFAGWPIETVDRLVSQVGDALAYAHSKGIVHSDLKPSNIFMTSDGGFKVYDFGIARAVNDVSTGDGDNLDESLVALTPAYASVGMLLDETAKPADDLYALGCVVYMAATSKHPYQRATALVAREKHLPLAPAKILSKQKSKALCDVLDVVDPSIDEVSQFTEAYNYKAKRNSLFVVIGSFFFAVVLVAVVFYASGYRERVILQQLTSNDVDDLSAGVEKIQKMDAENRFRFLETSRSELIDFYQQKSQQQMQQRDYLLASRVLVEAREFYPDSMALSALQEKLKQDQLYHYQQLKSKGESLMATGSEVALQAQLPTLVAALRRVNGGHELLSQWQLDQWLAQKINEAMYLGGPHPIEVLLALADVLYPDDSRFAKIHKTFKLMQASAKHRLQGGYQKNDQGAGNNPRLLNNASINGYQELWATYEDFTQQNDLVNETAVKINWRPEQLKKFLEQLDQSNSAWDSAFSSAVRQFVVDQHRANQHRANQQGSGKGSLDIAKRYQQFGKQLYPNMSNFKTKKKIVDPCKSWWAGKGRSTNYQCRDSISTRTKAPALVVIPKAKNIRSFAIMQTEVSVAQYNVYCRLYRRCTVVVGDSSLPVTNISYQDAKRYANWLSQMTGFYYRLPKLKEWRHAVGANNQQQLNDHNCLLTQGTKVIRGNSLRRVTQGTANAWGVVNGLGNVQEWAFSGSNTYKTGGSALTPLADCQITHAVSSGQDNNLVTGMRLVRELK